MSRCATRCARPEPNPRRDAGWGRRSWPRRPCPPRQGRKRRWRPRPRRSAPARPPGGRVDVEGEDLPTTEVAVEVGAVESSQLVAAIDEAADDGAAALRVRVDGDRRPEARGRAIVACAETAETFADVPAVVAAALQAVDLLRVAHADVAAPERARRRIEGDAPGVAQAVRPDLGSRALDADNGLSDGTAYGSSNEDARTSRRTIAPSSVPRSCPLSNGSSEALPSPRLR